MRHANTCRSVWVAPPRLQAKHTVPTGLPGTAPVGPAMPVVDSATWALLLANAPSAMAAATSTLTAPTWAIRAAGTSSNAVLEALE
jgi:hypothetical protein